MDGNNIPSPYYNESHHKLRKYLREYWETKISPFAEEWEKAGVVPSEVYAEYAMRGMILPSLPKQYRDTRNNLADIPEGEWDLFHAIIFVEESYRHAPAGVIWGLGSGNGIGCPPILNFGSEEQRKEYLPRVHRGEIRFCLGITEPETGSDVAGIRTTAVLSADKSHYIVNGAKKWITNGIWADYVTAAVRTGGSGINGISVLIIPLKNTPGVVTRRIPISGLNASGSTYIGLSDVRVPVRNLVGRENEGFKIIMSNFNPERLSLAVTSLSLAQICFEEAWEHAHRRKTFGKPLIENQIIRAKFSAMARANQSCRAWVEQIVYQMQHQENAAQDLKVGAQLALVKVQAGKVLEMCCREAQQIFGGLGVTKDGRGRLVEQISRDLRVFVVGGGSEEILDDLAVRLMSASLKLADSSHSKL